MHNEARPEISSASRDVNSLQKRDAKEGRNGTQKVGCTYVGVSDIGQPQSQKSQVLPSKPTMANTIAEVSFPTL